jgi:hypothetical protein
LSPRVAQAGGFPRARKGIAIRCTPVSLRRAHFSTGTDTPLRTVLTGDLDGRW